MNPTTCRRGRQLTLVAALVAVIGAVAVPAANAADAAPRFSVDASWPLPLPTAGTAPGH